MKKQLLLLSLTVLLTISISAQDYALQFDGMGSRVKYTNDASLEIMNGVPSYTLEAWVYPADEDIHNKVVIKRWNSFAITLFQNDNKRVYFTHYADNGDTKTYVNSLYNVITLNEWNHIVVISDGAENTLKLYVNGVDVTANYAGDATSYNALSLDAAPGADANFYVGYGGSGTLLNGYADKIRVLNVAEDVADLQTSINDADYDADATTALLLKFNEGTGTTTANDAPAGVDAELSCYGTDCTDIPEWVLMTAVSVNENNTTSFSIFPNPVSNGVLAVQAEDNDTIESIVIRNILGQTVKSAQFDTNTNTAQISVENLISGHYLVQTKTNNGTGVKKLIIN